MPGPHPVPDWIRRGTLRWVWGLWEPLLFYRRSAHMAPYSPGNALWAEDWYRRMHSEEIVAKLAELGVNCITTHYYKGFGVRAEAEEMDRAARFTELCHTYGMRVLGYHQWGTICYETFLDEVPDAEQWTQRTAEGKPLLYGGTTYWRWFGCPQCDAFVAYLCAVVRRCLTEARMDGIEWDGTWYKCHCERCQQAFCDYLQRTYADADVARLFGIPHFRHVRIPTTEDRRDPLFQALLSFRGEFFIQRLREYNDLIKSLNPQAAQVTYVNDPAPAGPIDGVDIIVDENHAFPFVEDGVLTTKFRGLKHGSALDRVVLSTSWLRAPSTRGEKVSGTFCPQGPKGASHKRFLTPFPLPVGSVRRPETPAEVKRDLAEDAMFGAHMITPTWATRPTGGDRAAFEEPALHEALRSYMGFFRQHEPLYDVCESLANVAVVRARSAMTLDYFNVYPCVVGVEQVCLQHQIPFDTVFSFQLHDLAKYDALVLAEQTCLGDDEIAKVTRFVERGGGLVVTGHTGLFDERFRHRRAHPLAAVLDHPRVVFFPDNPERLSRPERDHPPAYRDFHLPARSAEIAEAIVRAAGGRLPYRVDAGRFVGTDAYRVASGRRVIHLVNYDNDQPLDDVVVTLDAWPDVPEARVVSPDAQPADHILRADGPARNRFVLPVLETYAILVLAPG